MDVLSSNVSYVDILTVLEKVSVKKLPLVRLKYLKNWFGNMQQFQYLYYRIRSAKPVKTMILDNYLLLIYAIGRKRDRYDVVVVMYDITTNKFYVDRRPFDYIDNIYDVYMLLGYLEDCDNQNVFEISDVWKSYRIQGDLVLEVYDEKLFIDSLIDSLRSQIDDILVSVIIQRLSQFLRDMFGFEVVVLNRGNTRRIFIPHSSRFNKKVSRDFLRLFTRKLGDVIKENVDVLFGDIIDFIVRSNNVDGVTYSVYVFDEVYEISVYVNGNNFAVGIRLFIGHDRHNYSLTLVVDINNSKYNRIVERIMSNIKFEHREFSFGNHLISLSNASPNVFQVNVDFGFRELRNVLLNVRSTHFLVKDSELIVSHREHGLRTLFIKGLKSVVFRSVTNMIARQTNTYILKDFVSL